MSYIDAELARVRTRIAEKIAQTGSRILPDGTVLTPAQPTPHALLESGMSDRRHLTASARSSDFSITVTSSRLAAENLTTATQAALAAATAATTPEGRAPEPVTTEAASPRRHAIHESLPDTSPPAPAPPPAPTHPAVEPPLDPDAVPIPTLDTSAGRQQMQDLLAALYRQTPPRGGEFWAAFDRTTP